MSHEVYVPGEEILRGIPIGRSYVELWRGLPDLDFKPAESSGGLAGLVYRTRGSYVWVNPEAVKVLRADHEALLIVNRTRKENGALYVWDVSPISKFFGHTVEQAIAVADRLNFNKQITR